MYKHVSTLEAFNFYIHDNKFYYWNGKSQFSDSKDVLFVAPRAYKTGHFNFFGHYVWFDSESDKIWLNSEDHKPLFKFFDLTQKIFILEEHKLKDDIATNIECTIGDDNLYIESKDGDEVNRLLLNVSTGEYKKVNASLMSLISDPDIAIRWIEDDHMNFIGIAALDLNSGNEIWRYEDLRDLGVDQFNREVVEEFGHILGVVEGRLWLSIKPERILALNLKTGKVELEHYSTVSGKSSKGDQSKEAYLVAAVEYYSFIEEEKKLIFFSDRVYCEFDMTAKQPKWVVHDVSETFAEFGLDSVGVHVLVRKHLIYFHQSATSKIAVFDRNTRKILWSTHLKPLHPDAAGLNKLGATDTHLYALDRYQHLFIFEREV